jgi:hypothetical protein
VDGGSPITVVCSTPSSCSVTGLDPGTTYLVRVQADWGARACRDPWGRGRLR